ncbi:MAG: hypothetical protein HYY64_14620 [Candidatus Rokubacteria bacterium]|nr:hypothetical protein [Candidatus Rokubacteria bacterium]
MDYPVEVYVAELAQVRRRFYLHALAGAVLALVAGALIARRITRPVTRLATLRQEAGSQFDPRVVDAALSVPADQWEEIR